MTERSIASLVNTMEAAADRVRDVEHVTTRFSFGGHVVEVMTPERHGPTEIPLRDGFLTSGAEGEPDFRLTLIDDAAAGGRPRVGWPAAWQEPFGIVRANYAGQYRVACDVYSGSVAVFDPRSRHAIVWVHDVSAISYWFAATPFRLQLSWFADSFEGEMVHAAGLVIDSGAVLLVGPSGAGKSTLALSATLAGVRSLGDDFLLIRDLQAQAVYRRAKVHDSTIELLDGRAGRLGPVLNPARSGEKRIIDLHPHLLCTEARPITAIVVPQRSTSTSERPAVRRVPGADALRHTLGPTMMGLLGGSKGTLTRLAEVVRRVPTFIIDVGPNCAENAQYLVHSMRDVLADRPSARS